MKRVTQTDTSREKGDCQRACVASLLDLDIEAVPNFRLFSDDIWWDVFCGFLFSVGYDVVEVKFCNGFKQTKDGLLLAAIKSNYGNGFSHQVLINENGDIIHDPLPNYPFKGVSVDGILDHWYMIRKI